MPTSGFDVAIVGLGAVGAATLMHLVKSGVRAVGIDQYSPPHSFGSSHGDTRITRLSIGEGAAYVPLVKRSHELWRSIEAEANVELLTITGGLILDGGSGGFVHGVDGFVSRTVELAKRFSIPHEILSTSEAESRFPEFRFEAGAYAYFEPSAGFVRPEAAIQTQLSLAQRHGAAVRCNERVEEISASSSGTVHIRTTKGVLEVGQCLVAAGPWLKNFIPERLRGLFKIRRQVLHWLPIERGSYAVQSSPIFIWCFGSEPEDWIYGFPTLDGATIKVASESYVESSSPESIDRQVSLEEQQLFYETKVAHRLGRIVGMPIKSVTCQYTVTPQAQFIIDTHPEMTQVLVASCCSGHGFKHSAALGESIAAILRGQVPSVDISAFRSKWNSKRIEPDGQV